MTQSPLLRELQRALSESGRNSPRVRRLLRDAVRHGRDFRAALELIDEHEATHKEESLPWYIESLAWIPLLVVFALGVWALVFRLMVSG